MRVKVHNGSGTHEWIEVAPDGRGFVGQVMKATGGKANPQAVNALVKAKLGIE